MPCVIRNFLAMAIVSCCLGNFVGAAAQGATAQGKLATAINQIDAKGNATQLSSAIINALAADAGSVNGGLGDIPAFASSVAQRLSHAPQDIQTSALGRAIAVVLNNCSLEGHCFSGNTTRFAGVTQAAIIVDIAVAAGLRSQFNDIFGQAKELGCPVGKLTNSISFGLVAPGDVAAAVTAINAVFGATVQALNQAGNASQVAQLLLASAQATVALGEPSVHGSDNIANKTNDINGAAALATIVKQSHLARSTVDAAFSAAIAKGLNESSNEATAVLIAGAMMVDNSTAMGVAAAGMDQALAANRAGIIGGIAPLCQVLFASEDLGPAYGNVTQGAIVTSSLGSRDAADLQSSSNCRRYPGVVG